MISAIILPVFLSGIFFILFLKLFPGRFNYPLDLGLEYKGKRLFGENKTIRGPIIMSILTGIFGILVSKFADVQVPNFTFISYAIIGLLYSIGELPNSFIKRQLNISPGKQASESLKKNIFVLFDTFDSLVFCGAGYIILFKFDFKVVILCVLLGGLLHLGTDLFMKKLHLK